MPLPQNTTEATALDTSGDGQLSPLDSPFSPYYPGDEYVDWVGLSVYYKGPNSQNINVAQPSGYCYGALRNNNPNNGVDTADPWYENYCVGRNKACMVSHLFSLFNITFWNPFLDDRRSGSLELSSTWNCMLMSSYLRSSLNPVLHTTT